jgi:DNA polymerase III delta prime subunit
MLEINGYQIICKVELDGFGEYVTFWKCEKNTTLFDIVTIESVENNRRMLDRLLKTEIKSLIDDKFLYIQKVVEAGWHYEEEIKYMYIVYEDISYYRQLREDHLNASLPAFKDILNALNILRKNNKQVNAISTDTIFVNEDGNAKLACVGLFEFFKEQNLLNEASLAPDIINKKDYRPNFQDDIYSVVKTFEPFLRGLNDESANKILEKALSPDRNERFSNYLDILELVERINYKPKFTKVIKIGGTNPGKKEEYTQMFEEMNEKCYMIVENSRSADSHDITGVFSTDNWHGRFFVKPDDVINFLIYDNAPPLYDGMGGNWFPADFSFMPDESTNFDAYEFFEKKLRTQNQLAELNKTKTESVKKWQTLPEKEREYIEENAFRVRYSKVKFYETNAEFSLVNSFDSWERIKTLKNEETALYIGDVKVGKIGNFRPKDKCIVLKDILCTEDEMAETGELYEDVRQKTSQYKKQVEACQKFKTQNVVNPDICSILATPATAKIPDNDRISEDDYKRFNDEVFDPNLKADDTQREAVLEALSYKPIYLIQGPPGTGKTTVIVELVRRIIKIKTDAKILVTSQSNLAVDNVLERIEEVNKNKHENLLFMRLASESDDKDINVTESIKPHTYERKLMKWVKETREKSEEFFNKKFLHLFFPKQNDKNTLIAFYDTILNINDESFVEFKKKLNNSGNYIKRLFENAKKYDDVKKIFERELGSEFFKFRKIQKSWFAFLNNVTSEKNKSMLNDGSQPIDFLTAMMKSVNIIGATCIHIASSKYSKVDFKFDYVIMDESSKASPAETLVPINMGKRIVLIGDHKQLPPVITREEAVKKKVKDELDDNGLDIEKTFGESLFEKLIKAFEENDDSSKYVKMLDIQYRMPKQIGSLISKYFYDGKLKNPSENVIPNYDKNKHHGLNLKNNTSIVFISSSNRENCNDNGNKYKRQNKCNVQIIEELLTKLNELYPENSQKEKPYAIGVIAGYRGQVELLKNSINLSQYKNFVVYAEKDRSKSNLIEINTVDKFQGAERDIIIYDVVRSDKGTSNIGFLDDYRRINVAFSRAKRLLIIVGDSEYLIKRARLNPGGKFEEFKLQQIAQDLQKEGLIFNSLDEVLL